ncbi:hypothetical protein [Paludibaculum fermentans]|uniref:Arc family DNA binding domain-containing protein n=1 Tax=Paludibaculum fermentans TaxID=1473598 RepID=A0A7S7NJZ1_PALFE|nr:hypothetical protein [Paludibaculum fermentans]QOY85023.1 hypothetical protein IRI77_19435 [Paludibaculum fermentans]
MAERKSFLLRIDGEVLEALRKWADDDLRSLNGQIEFLLRKAMRDRRRFLGPVEPPVSKDDATSG